MNPTVYRVQCPDCGLSVSFEQPALDDPSLEPSEREYLEEELKQEIRAWAQKFQIGHKNRQFALGRRCHPQLHATNGKVAQAIKEQTRLGIQGA